MKVHGFRWCGLLTLLVAAAACTKRSNSARRGGEPCGSTADCVVRVEGAGTDSARQIFSMWAAEYGKRTPRVRVSYQPTEPRAAVRQLGAGALDFAVSDVANPSVAAGGKLQHLPLILNALAVVYHEASIGKGLRLSAKALAGVLLGRLSAWNDPVIAEANPDAQLPADRIVVVGVNGGPLHNEVVARYLARSASGEADHSSARMTQAAVAGDSDESTAREVQATAGSLAFVTVQQAILAGAAVASIENPAGRYVLPTSRTMAFAVRGVSLPDSLVVSLVDGQSPDAYPMCFFSYVLLPKNAEPAAEGEALLRFLWWVSHDGQAVVEPMHYAPLPARVVAAVEGRLKELKAGGRQVLAGP